MTIFMGGGGYSETLRFGVSDNFHFEVGYSETVLQNRGHSEDFGPKIQPIQQAHASQIVSHILRMRRLIKLQLTQYPLLSDYCSTYLLFEAGSSLCRSSSVEYLLVLNL